MILDMAVVFALADPTMLGWNLMASKGLGAGLALVNNFVWNEVWTFRGLGDCRWGSRWDRFCRFGVVCGVGIGVSAVLLQLLVDGLGMRLLPANGISIAMVSVWNFHCNLRFSWRGRVRAGGLSSRD